MQDATPFPELAPDRAERATEEARGQGGLTEEFVQYVARRARALQDELPNSRTLRRRVAGMQGDIEVLLPPLREMREHLARRLEELTARLASKDAASLAFTVASCDRYIEALEAALEEFARRIATEEEFEAMVAGAAELAEFIARCREDTAAPTCADRGRNQLSAFEEALRKQQETGALEDAERMRQETSEFERAYAETGNPLYVWDALSLLCVPGGVDGDTPPCLLPGWCAEYIGRAAEAILGLPPPGIHPEHGMAEQAPALSKALGLSRQGWDAYAERRRVHDRERKRDLFARVKALGIRHKDAESAALEFWDLEDARSVRRSLSKARRAKPRPTKPAS